MISVDKIHSAAEATLPADFPAEDQGGLMPLRAVVLTIADLQDVVDLHERVFQAAPTGAVRHDDASFFSGVLQGGAVLGFKTEDVALAAYGVLTFPAPHEFHYGRILGLPEAQWPLLAQLEGVSVDPNWQGRGLHRRLGLWRIQTASVLGIRHICATVSPNNFYSLKNLFSLGLSIRSLHRLYGGLQRYVMQRDLRESGSCRTDREVGADDLALQERLFVAGAWAHGWRGSERPGTLLFALRKES